MQKTRDFLARMGLPAGDAHDLPTSAKHFPDGAQYRVEIPSVEGPKAFQALLEAAQEHGVLIHRISQGSGVMLQTDEEIAEMAHLGREEKIEVSLFVGPRAPWDIVASPLTPAGKNIGVRAHGMEQVVYALEDIKRACALGIRGVLIADEGVLWAADEMRRSEELPRELIIKISVQMGAANPASIRLMEKLGADTYNIPSDMTLAKIAAIRQAVDIPLDIYVEVPDDFGGFIRHYEIPEIVRVAAPV
ncbi:MAG: U32 family peptidase, partial [Chloroflexota bacterium]|nr:U32 family peptidase [Chloroflexota bacterium]